MGYIALHLPVHITHLVSGISVCTVCNICVAIIFIYNILYIILYRLVQPYSYALTIESIGVCAACMYA